MNLRSRLGDHEVGSSDDEQETTVAIADARFDHLRCTATMDRHGFGAYCPVLGVAEQIGAELDGERKRVGLVAMSTLR